MADEFRTPFDQGMALLDELGRSLQGVAEYDDVLRLGAQTAMRLADLAIIVAADGDGQSQRVRVAHVNPHLAGEVAELLQRAMPSLRAAAARDLSSKREFRWVHQVTPISVRFLRNDPDLVELLSRLAVQSFLVVPLRSGGRIFGAMALCRVRDNPLQAADLAIAQVLARRVALALEQAQMYERSPDEQGRRFRLEAAVHKWIRVFDVAGWGAAIVDGSDQRIEAVNPAFAELHGYPEPLALVGRKYTDLLPPERMPELGEWRSVSETHTRPYETIHLRADGSLFPVLTDVTVLEMEEGVTSFVVTIQDVTELKRAEERLRRAQRLEAVGRLAGGVAHEVNNMMTIILGFTDLLSRSGAVMQGRERDLEEIRKAATRAGKTTQQLLAFSRQQILQPIDLDLNQVINGILPALRLLLPANIVVDTSLAPMGVRVHADRAQLEQVLINLAFNARDAMPGGGTLRLLTDSRWLDDQSGRRLIGIPIRPGQYATVSVIDTGHGMDASTVTQVFEPFFTTKPVGSGTGLGLATVYGTVKQSGGYVWVESTPDEGTTVTVCLPQIDNVVEDRQGTVDREVTSAKCRSGTILVIEDEDGVRDLARRVLEQQGHRVLEARDGPAAVQALEESGQSVDLVLSDVIIPEIGTVELEQEVRQHRPNLPILYMSGYSRFEVVERGLVPPGGPFLQKPFTAEELTQLVCEQLEPGGDGKHEPVPMV
jgi:two-component system, cell cycle sensor histidine kinase and response regulator CckA